MKLKWEIIEEEGINTIEIKEYETDEIKLLKTQKLKVWNGWIVERIQGRNIVYNYFIEDPDHLWGGSIPEGTVDGAGKCPSCEAAAFLYSNEGDKGGHCLACKIRYCAECGESLQTEDLIEKCKCGHVNEWEVKE